MYKTTYLYIFVYTCQTLTHLCSFLSFVTVVLNICLNFCRHKRSILLYYCIIVTARREAMNYIHILVYLKLRWQHFTLCGGGGYDRYETSQLHVPSFHRRFSSANTMRHLEWFLHAARIHQTQGTAFCFCGHSPWNILQFKEITLRKPLKFTNKRSVAAAADSPSQPSNTSVKIKGHIGQHIPENRIIRVDPKLY